MTTTPDQQPAPYPTPSISGYPPSGKAVILALYRYFTEGRLEDVRALLHPHAVWIQMEGFPGGGTYEGREAIAQKVFTPLKHDWQDWQARVDTIIEAGQDVFVTGRYSGTFRLTGKAFSADFMHHYQLENGSIIRFKQYTDTAQMFKATLPSP